jgi:hypothetical protein
VTDTTKGAAETVAQLRKAAAALAKHEAGTARLVAARDAAMAACRAAGVRPGLIAEAAGVSAGRVSQVAPAPERAAAKAKARAPRDEPMTFVPTVPEGPIMSGRATRHHEAPYTARVAAWVDLTERHGVTALGTHFVLGGNTLADTLADLPREVTRVYVTGDWAGVPQVTETRTGNVRAWGTAKVDGWKAGTHWTSTDEPVFRYTQTRTSRDVEILSAAGWFGDAGPRACADAWAELAATIAATFPGGTLLATPASTGRDLWQRTIGRRVEYPTLSQPVRDLITATSGQGRTELRPGGGEVDGFTYMDGRFMYAALMYGLPVGEAEHIVWNATGPVVGTGALNKRGRWRATVEVPAGWRHVGILGRQTAAGWDYPAEPGTSWEGWHDACELRLAIEHGWAVTLHEGIVWQREGKPLTEWRDILVDAWSTEGNPLVRGALRAIVLFGLGGFAARTPMAEGWADTEAEVPAGATVHREGGRFRYTYRVTANAWQEQMAHPEWPATVWARARVALLDHRLPDGTRGGALHLPAEDVIGFRTDAIYVAGDAPAWADDGRPGRFRVKGRIDGPVEWPASGPDLLALRERSEHRLEQLRTMGYYGGGQETGK